MKSAAGSSIISIVLGVVLSASALAATNPEQNHLDLEKCVEIAIRNSTLVLKSQNDVTLSGEQLLQSYAQFLPTLDVGASYGYNWGKRQYAFTGLALVDSTYRNAQFLVRTTLNLFNGFSDLASFKASRARADVSSFTLIRAKQQIATDVTQNYYQVTLDRLFLDIDQANLDADKARLGLLNTQTQVGNATLADLSRQQAQVATDQSTLITAQARLRDDELLLLQKLRLDPQGSYSFDVPDLNVSETSITRSEQDLIESALHERTDVSAAASLTRATSWDVKTARGDYYPKLGVAFNILGAGNYLLTQSTDGVNTVPPGQPNLWTQLGNQVTYAFSLNLTWNILDQGLTRLATARARISNNNSEIDLEDRKFQVQTEIRQVYNDFNAASRQLQSATSSTQAATRAYQIVEGRYKVGASSFVDLITAQAALIQAKTAEAQARVALKFQSKLLEFYLGKTPVH